MQRRGMCQDCDSRTNGDCGMHQDYFPRLGQPQPLLPYLPAGGTGWRCPGCGLCYAPWMPSCQSCGQGKA